MNEKGFIQYIVIIIIILVIVFLSQQVYFKKIGKNLYDQSATQIGGYWQKAGAWVSTNVYPKLSSEAARRGEAIKTEAVAEKQKVSENIGENIKNYFSGVVDSVFNPGKNNSTNCPAQTSSNSGQ